MTLRARLAAGWDRHADRALLAGAAAALAAGLLQTGVPAERALVEQVIVLDITQSMNVQDYQLDGKPVSRLAYAKHALRDALLQLPCGSKIGWGIFTEYRSFLLLAPIEVCAHLNELRATLQAIDGRMAWTGNSEVAKGLYSGLALAAQLPQRPAMVLFTDGHEAPPVNPRYRPPFTGERGKVPGLIVGVGDARPQPIPKLDASGRPLGYWRADEVLQTDPRSRGRAGSVAGERMVEDAETAPAAPLPGATPGAEHLSSLREDYLRLLASETGLGFHRLGAAVELPAALQAPALARPAASRADLGAPLAAVALALLLARHLLPLGHRWAARRRQHAGSTGGPARSRTGMMRR